MVKIELKALGEDSRIAESELRAKQEKIRADVARGLLWLAGQVLATWPDLDKTGLRHRMGDYALIVRAVDKVLRTEGEKRLADEGEYLAHDVVEASPLAL